MEASPCITINSTVSIPLNELRYRTTRSGGPGGQHVKK
jgi:protein subunit release factor B